MLFFGHLAVSLNYLPLEKWIVLETTTFVNISIHCSPDNFLLFILLLFSCLRAGHCLNS